MNDLILARILAAKGHAGQMYGEEPYTVHLDEVEQACRDMFPGEDRLPILAQLHDIVEDTRIGVAILEELFDNDIVLAVEAMTKATSETREEYLIRCKKNELARKCKMADSFCNMRRSLMRGHMRRVKKYGETLALLADGG